VQLADVDLDDAPADDLTHGPEVYTRGVSQHPVGPYVPAPAAVVPWDERATAVARRVAALVAERRPDLVVEHVGSTAVPGMPGKGIIDLGLATDPKDIAATTAVLIDLGFGPQTGPDPFPPTRPMLVGSMDVDGATFRIHLHVMPDHRELDRQIAFRDALRDDPELARSYADLKASIVQGGMVDGHQYTYQKQAWIGDIHRRLGVQKPPIAPPATIGILGGGQLGRMLGLAARAMGYRILVLDPDPDCPAAAISDGQIVAGYDDVGAALRLAERCAVVTYELEHVAIEVVAAIEMHAPVRPGRAPLAVTQDRLAERSFVASLGVEVAPWREVRSVADLRSAAEGAVGLPMRLKVVTGGYDGRGQVRIVSSDDLGTALGGLGRPRDEPLLAESELDFEAEVSVIVSRGDDGHMAHYPISLNTHDEGILVESVAPAPVDPAVVERAAALGERLAVAMGLVGTLTAELFLMRDGRLVLNELAPRVHNSGHWTIEGAATSQFEQHIRAICGLELGAIDALAPSAMVNVLGSGSPRAARLAVDGVGAALSDPAAHLHLYDKRRVFQRRKMGHVTALGTTTDDALTRARAAAARLRWADES